MRWPWQRSEARATDAAPGRAARDAAPGRAGTDAAPDAALRESPAGWAFLPPLQRQLSDAPPVVLRPAFVATLPTRTVPASLGTMGHLVDAAAPAGTVAADDAALGAPVQRAVAAELTLRPRVARSVPVQREAVTDAAVPASHESPVTSAVPEEPADVLEAPDLVAEGRDDSVLEQTPPSSAEAGHDAGASVARLVDDSISVLPVVSDATNARMPAIADASVEASAGAALTLPDRQGASSSADERPAPSADHPSPTLQNSSTPISVIRPTLQRIDSAESGAGAGAEAGAGMPPSIEAPTKRVGLGAPLPSRSVQRATSDVTSGPAQRLVAHPRTSPLPATTTHIDGFQPPHDAVLQRDVDAGEAPLLADLPIPLVVSPADSAAASTSRPTPPQGDAAPGATSASRSLASAAPAQNRPLAAVQRQAETVAGRIPTPRSSIADPSPVGPVPHVVKLADGPPAAATSTEATPVATTPAEAASTDGRSVVDLPSGHAETEFSEGPALPVQRTVPLVAARRIVPVLDRQTLALPAASRSRHVVVARVVAPSPTASERGGAAPVSMSGTPSRAAGSAAAIGVSATGSRSTSHESAGSAAAEPWTSGPDGAASVSRLLDPPQTDDIEGWTEARTPAPAASVVAATTPRTSTGPRFDSSPPVVQRLPGFPSLPKLPSALPSGLPSPGQLPSGLPSLPQLPTDVPSLGQLPADLPSREQLESRATDLASEARDSARSAAETLTAPATAAASGVAAAAGGGTENVEQLVRKLYGPLVRRIKAELLLDRERRGIRIDGI